MYTIKFLDKNETQVNKMKERLLKSLLTSRFTAKIYYVGELLKKNGKGLCLEIGNIRLKQAKSYCGNHPGECPVSDRKKPVMSLLEWEDYVEFNNRINKVLTKYKCNADMWSLPHDVKGKFWMRKGLLPRLRYDWTEQNRFGRFNNIVRIWNPGTPDQFE